MRLTDRRHHCDTHAISVLWVVRVLSIVVIGGTATMAFAAFQSTPAVPPEIDKLTHAALGALVAMLSQTRNEPAVQPVHVDNAPDQPVPVEEAKG